MKLATVLIVLAVLTPLHLHAQYTLTNWEPMNGCSESFPFQNGSGIAACSEVGYCSGGLPTVTAYACAAGWNCEWGFTVSATSTANYRAGQVFANSTFDGLAYGFFACSYSCNGDHDDGIPFTIPSC